MLSSESLPAGSNLTVGAGGVFAFDPSAADAPLVAAQSAAVSADAVAAVPEPGMFSLLAAFIWSARFIAAFNLPRGSFSLFIGDRTSAGRTFTINESRLPRV